MFQVRTAFKLLETYDHKIRSGRVFWLHRVFTGGVDKDFEDNKEYKRKDFDDSVDPHNPKPKDHLDKLIAWMKRKFLPKQLREYGETSFSDCVNNTPAWKDQLQLMSNDAYEVLETSLNSIISSRREWMADSGGLCVPGAVGVEILHHCNWARQKCEDFFCRSQLVQEGVRQIFERRTANCFENDVNEKQNDTKVKVKLVIKTLPSFPLIFGQTFICNRMRTSL